MTSTDEAPSFGGGNLLPVCKILNILFENTVSCHLTYLETPSQPLGFCIFMQNKCKWVHWTLCLYPAKLGAWVSWHLLLQAFTLSRRVFLIRAWSLWNLACSVKFHSINMFTELLLSAKHCVRLLVGSKEEKTCLFFLNSSWSLLMRFPALITFLFNYLFNTRVLSTSCVPGRQLGAGDTAWNKYEKVPALMILHPKMDEIDEKGGVTNKIITSCKKGQEDNEQWCSTVTEMRWGPVW